MPKHQPEDRKSKTYTHTFENGSTITLPRFDSVMTFGRTRRLRKLSPDDLLFTVMEEVCTEDQLAVLDEMGTEETEAFFTEWQEDSGVSLGESEGSST